MPISYQLGTSRYELVQLVTSRVRLGPCAGQEFCDVFAVAMIVRQFAEDVLHPFSRVHSSSFAAADQRVHDGCAICRCIVPAEEVVLPAQSQRPDGPDSQWRSFIRLRALFIKMYTSPLQGSHPMQFDTIPLRV